MPFDLFLNTAAVAEADEKFFARHPEFVKPDGTPRARNPILRRNRALKSEWYGYYNEAKRAARVEEPTDNVDPVDTVAPCPYATNAAYCVPIKRVRLTSLTFDNKIMIYDEEEKWTYKTGVPYPPTPDWTPKMEKPNPIVVAFDDPGALDMTITYEVDEKDACPQTGTIRSIWLSNETNCHHPKTDADLSPAQEHRVAFKAIETPARAIQAYQSYTRPWFAEIGTRRLFMGQNRNQFFTTWGEPKIGKYIEDGPTYKRMLTSTVLAARAKSIDELTVIAHLFSMFPGYALSREHLSDNLKSVLEKDEALLTRMTEAGWPSYMPRDQTEKVGAWPIDATELTTTFDGGGSVKHFFSCECQAICRFIRGIMRQLGAKSEIDIIYCTADWNEPFRPINRNRGVRGPKVRRRHYALVDGPVEVGGVYPTKGGIGFNRYEAYMKVTPPDGPARLFGGGVGLIAEDRNPLSVFKSVVAFEDTWILGEKAGDPGCAGYKIIEKHDYTTEAMANWDGVIG